MEALAHATARIYYAARPEKYKGRHRRTRRASQFVSLATLLGAAR